MQTPSFLSSSYNFIGCSITEIVERVKMYEIQLIGNAKIKETCDTYIQLRGEMESGGVTPEFRRMFSEFYVLRYMDQSATEKYFDIMHKWSDTPYSLETLLLELQKASTEDKLYLSYATKLLNLFEPDTAIYDTNVAKTLKITLPVELKDKITLHQELNQLYFVLCNDENIKALLLQLRGEYSSEHISDKRLLDIILWQTGEIIMQEGDYGKGRELARIEEELRGMYHDLMTAVLALPYEDEHKLWMLELFFACKISEGIQISVKGKQGRSAELLRRKQKQESALDQKTLEQLLLSSGDFGFIDMWHRWLALKTSLASSEECRRGYYEKKYGDL